MRKTSEIFGKNRCYNYCSLPYTYIFGWINIYSSMYNDDISYTIYDLNTKHGNNYYL